jgi:hypothetical protein
MADLAPLLPMKVPPDPDADEVSAVFVQICRKHQCRPTSHLTSKPVT